jgi:ankyrin repeat protein
MSKMSKMNKLKVAIQDLDIDGVMEVIDDISSDQLNMKIDSKTPPPLFLLAEYYGNEAVNIDNDDNAAAIAEELIKHGADVDLMIDGKTPLSVCKMTTVADILISNGATIDKGLPLHKQIEDSNISCDAYHHIGEADLTFENVSNEMAMFLISNGANIYLRDENGNLPIHLANHGDIIEHLHDQI